MSEVDPTTLRELDPKAGEDQASLTYTQLPVPAELTVKTSGIPGAELGVFANQLIPRNVKMGPFEGKKVEEEEVEDVSCAWEVGIHQVEGAVPPPPPPPPPKLQCTRLENQLCIRAEHLEEGRREGPVILPKGIPGGKPSLHCVGKG